VLYTGTEEQWNQIDFETENNQYFVEATRHYGMTGNEIIPANDALDTCTDDAVRVCTICDDIFFMPIQDGQHTWEAATCDTAKTCTVCAATEGEALGHHYGDWTQVKVPTTEETGLEERVCTNCGNKEQREVDKMEPAPTEPKPTEPAQTKPVQTAPAGGDAVEQEQGERGNSTLWIAVICGLGGVALGVFVMLIVLMKKKEK
jgi:hypothetical protein